MDRLFNLITNAVSDPVTGIYVAGGALLTAVGIIVVILHTCIKAQIELETDARIAEIMREAENTWL